ncbi:hypothetical protein [Flavobacterium macacae]|uniref:Uncharacterized protein n=1 Tax=Flavobacterium macacae TaxID=2488993 RepID=A0A3P3W503_9FLAO|nr:hypothetical protein [Flavobacterium macacae]RRJ90181.1 hypothetical protein EG849_11015 [Flavobacterium macacae]
MKNNYFLALTFVALTCFSQQEKYKAEKCAKIYKNNFTKINFVKKESNVGNGTILLNEMRYECVASASSTRKGMFDKFGIWDKEIYITGTKHPILVWSQVDLFSDGRKIDVFANGIEEFKHIYASVMVFENGIDLLAETCMEKEKISEYFSNLIKNEYQGKSDFYEIYWKKVDPKYWETIKYFHQQ